MKYFVGPDGVVYAIPEKSVDEYLTSDLTEITKEKADKLRGFLLPPEKTVER